ncbi:hypothetical protein ACFLW3_00460 [Chloroflexota bacterium]
MINKRYFIGVYTFSILAVIFVIVMLFIGSPEIRWIALAVGLAVISLGLGLSSFYITLEADTTTRELKSRLERIEQGQQEILAEIREGRGSGTPIVASLDALTKYYTDYMQRQNRGDDQP